jgi:nitronate monooxygenase
VSLYLSKGGHVEDTVGRKCVCNGLVANIGLQQVRAGGKHVELGLITAGDDLENIADFLPAGASSYSAADVLTRLLRCSAMTSPRAIETAAPETHDLLVTVDSWAGI